AQPSGSLRPATSASPTPSRRCCSPPRHGNVRRSSRRAARSFPSFWNRRSRRRCWSPPPRSCGCARGRVAPPPAPPRSQCTWTRRDVNHATGREGRMPVTIDDVLGRLDGVERNGEGWRARCPVHKGPRRSLTIRRGTHLVALFRCWAVNCSRDDILAALRLTRADLRTGAANAIETVYVLHDAAGAVVAEHVRHERPGAEKKLFWRRHGRNGLGGLKPRAWPLDGAHGLAKAAPPTAVVITEGEKARDALAARQVLAVGTVTGAAGIPADAVLRQVLDLDVYLWADNDDV